MGITGTRTCERCQTPVPLSNVRLIQKDSETNWLLCAACAELMKGKAKSVAFEPEKKPGRREKVYCTRCRYAFEVNLDKIGTQIRLQCPYCGKADKVCKPEIRI